MAMVDLEVEAEADLISKVDELALEYFGDTSDVSKGRVLEVGFRMRYLWAHLMEGGENEIGEPIASWEFPDKQSAQQLPREIRGWLFGR